MGFKFYFLVVITINYYYYYYYYYKCLYRIANSKYVIYTNSVLPLGPVTTMNITKEAVYARIGIILCYTLGCWGGDKIR